MGPLLDGAGGSRDHARVSPPAPEHRLVLGAMSGTSMDGLDVALVAIEGSGLNLRATLRRHHHRPFAPALIERLRSVTTAASPHHGELARLAAELGHEHVEAFARLPNAVSPDLAAVHGQTILHRPPESIQLLDPAPIAAAMGCPVVHDLRRADLEAGGQGAPITPLADWILFRGPRVRAVVNLGGFCNVTILPRDDGREPRGQVEQVRGFDVCACNQVLDAVARAALGCAFDAGGAAALRGEAAPAAADDLCAVLAKQRRAGRSLGTGDEAAAWVTRYQGTILGADLAATAVDAIARCIGDAIRDAGAEEVIVAGGGAMNTALVNAIGAACGLEIYPSDALGVPVQAREAVAMAVLGALCADGVPITLPQVTGCRTPAPVAGAWSHPPGSRAGDGAVVSSDPGLRGVV